MTATPKRTGNWMQTATGGAFWPIDPRPEDVNIEDIAHALSMMCRYGGHCKRFYSVAEHSVLMSRAVSLDNALWALLHDASEAYCIDVPRPLKPLLAGYKAIENNIMQAICKRFHLDQDMPHEVAQADERILADELAQNMTSPPLPWPERMPLGVSLNFWTPEQAKAEFLDRFEVLTDPYLLGVEKISRRQKA